jgi:hypothetical protein
MEQAAGAGGPLNWLLNFFGKLSWIGKGVTLGIAGAVSFAAQDLARNPDEFGYRLGQFQAYQRLGGAQAGEVPLSADGRANLDRLIRQISEHMEFELKQPKWEVTQGFVPWTVAQMTAATAGLIEAHKPTVQKFVVDTMDTSCSCWRELADKPEHVAVSGWVFYSLGLAGLKIPEPAVDFVLANQSADGWWPIYPAAANDRHAATYATAWALLGLEQYRARLKAGQQAGGAEREAKVTDAIQRGVRWLKKTRLPEEARWHDYPYYHTRAKAVGMAGHVLFTLHHFSREDELAPIDRIWMRTLDTRVLSAEETDSTDAYVIRAGGQMAMDGTRHIRLPWTMMATVKAFQRGTRWEQARALAWIERVLRADILTQSVVSRQWVTSELLLALRELKGALKPLKSS